MKDYKILIVKNRYSKKFDFKKNTEWFKKIGINIITDEVKTDFDIPTMKIGNATYNGVVAGNLHNILLPVAKWKQYHAVVFLYGNSLDGIRVSAANATGALYESTEIIQLAKVDWETLNHELFHCFFAKAIRRGANIVDNMDSYYRNNVLDLNQGETNRTIALKVLEPHWDKVVSFDMPVTTPPVAPSLPTVTITRTPNANQAPGKLVASAGGSTFICYSLELPWKDNKRNISCIPTGTYKAIWVYSASRGRYLYQLEKVTGRSSIQIHWGNYAAGKQVDIEGCILLGSAMTDINGDRIPDITNSKVTVQAFERFMNKKSFTLIIK